MTDQEKNEAVARWLRWTPPDFPGCARSFWQRPRPPKYHTDRTVNVKLRFTASFDFCLDHLIPKITGSTVLWVINNLDSPLPEIEYIYGFVRGRDNDLICWSRDLDPEECLSPVCSGAGEACVEMVLALIGEGDESH